MESAPQGQPRQARVAELAGQILFEAPARHCYPARCPVGVRAAGAALLRAAQGPRHSSGGLLHPPFSTTCG